jgi:hypothetical protein
LGAFRHGTPKIGSVIFKNKNGISVILLFIHVPFRMAGVDFGHLGADLKILRCTNASKGDLPIKKNWVIWTP